MPLIKKPACPFKILSALVSIFQLILHFQISEATSIIDILSLSPDQGISFSFGISDSNCAVSSAGDLNGDGYEDLLIGLPSQGDFGRSMCGIVYIVFGTVNGIPNVDINAMNPPQGIKIIGGASNAKLGFSVSNLGDISGDGIDDIIIGAPMEDKAYVLFGKKNGWTANLDLAAGLSSTQGKTIIGPIGSQLGFAVSSAGDFNGNGINDFMVSAPFADSGSGKVYIIFGQASFPSMIDLNTPLTALVGIQISGVLGDKLGNSLSKAGDVNGDGIDDILAGSASSPSGVVAIIYGSKSSVSAIQIDTMSLNQGFRIIGTSNIRIGTPASISSAGDLNNDGINDIVLGVPLFSASTALQYCGSAYVIYGKLGGFHGTIDLSTSFEGFQIRGPTAGAYFGKSCTSADINGDGFFDLIIGASRADPLGLTDAGMVYVLFGNKNGFKNVDLTSLESQFPQVLKILGDTLSSQFGYMVRPSKDLNANGVNDILGLAWNKASLLYGSGCEGITQCSSLSLSPVCYASKGCVCGEFNLYFQEDQCVAQCSQGYYLNIPICEPCPASCASCTSATECQTCKENFILKGTSCEAICPPGYYFTESTCQTNDVSGIDDAKTISSITGTTETIDSVGLKAAGLISPSDPGSVTASMLAKMLQYIRYLHIPYSQRLELTFKHHNSTYGPFGIGPKIPMETLLALPFEPVPPRFYKFSVHSSFLVNFWDSLIFMTIIVGILGLFLLFEWIVGKVMKNLTLYPLVKKIRAALQNFFLMQFYNIFGDILLFLILDMKDVNLVTPETTISLSLSIIFLLIGLIIVGVHIYILIRFYTFRKKKSWASEIESFSKQYEGSDVLFKYVKNSSMVSQSFLLIFVIRNCLFSLILGLLFEQALVQIILISTMSVVMLIYLVVQRPFTDLVNLFQHVVFETMLLVVNICVLIIAQIDFEKEGSYQLRDRLCEAIIYTSLIFSFAPQVFLVIKLIVAVVAWYKTFSKKPYQISKKNIELKRRNMTQNPSSTSFDGQNESLNESSVGLTVNQNTSNISLATGPAQQKRETGLQYNTSPQGNALKKFQADYDQRDLDFFRPQNVVQIVNKNKSRNTIESNQSQTSIFRRRSKGARKIL